MSAGERRAAMSLALIFALRMLGLFMILPVLSLHADDYTGSTPALVGLALGAYGMTQALLQIPFGLASDRVGRKRVIAVGLLLFAAGSVWAALAHSIYGVIGGRALQGAGAVAAAVMALAADLTREDHRTKAMAVIGMSIGLAFSVAMVAGPALAARVGLSGIFWITAVLAVLGLAVLLWWVPTPNRSRPHRDAEPVPAQFARVLQDRELLRLDFGILSLHMILTATFVVLPLVIRDQGGLAPQHHWWLYLPVLVLSVAAMIPLIIRAERRRHMKGVFLGGIGAIVVAELTLSRWHYGLVSIAAALFIFYVGFNLLESLLPSLVSKTSPPDSKGTAMGFYSTSQFLGAFLGGTLGGLAHEHWGVNGVFVLCAGIGALWWLTAAGMRSPRYLASRLLRVGQCDAAEARHLAGRLTEVRGVAEAVVIAEEGIAYLKVDSRALDEAALAGFALD